MGTQGSRESGQWGHWGVGKAISNLRGCRSGGGGGLDWSHEIARARIAATRGDSPPPLSLSLHPPTLHQRAKARWCQTPLARRPSPPDALANLAGQILRKLGWGQPVATSCLPMLTSQIHHPCNCAACPGLVYALKPNSVVLIFTPPPPPPPPPPPHPPTLPSHVAFLQT